MAETARKVRGLMKVKVPVVRATEEEKAAVAGPPAALTPAEPSAEPVIAEDKEAKQLANGVGTGTQALEGLGLRAPTTQTSMFAKREVIQRPLPIAKPPPVPTAARTVATTVAKPVAATVAKPAAATVAKPVAATVAKPVAAPTVVPGDKARARLDAILAVKSLWKTFETIFKGTKEVANIEEFTTPDEARKIYAEDLTKDQAEILNEELKKIIPENRRIQFSEGYLEITRNENEAEETLSEEVQNQIQSFGNLILIAEKEKKKAEQAEAKERAAEEIEADLQDFFIGEGILEKGYTELVREETTNPYKVRPDTLPKGFLPQNRRGFSYFIEQKFRQYTLKTDKQKLDYEACKALGKAGAELYLYQQFVRDYMSWETPYRGILVYHGLGSGKTCTAIAAAEALFSTTDKKIIIMTPASLRANFISEITKCGFRHFRLLNHWTSVPVKGKANGLNYIFAQNVLQIPVDYLKTVSRVWIPDFTKPQNYQPPPNATADELKNYLTPDERAEVKQQIEEIIEYDPRPSKKKYGRIWFLNYNGLSKKTLKNIFCNCQDSFDNKIIIIDEIHNLTRLMRGQIEPYIVNKPGIRRKKFYEFEPFTHERKKPVLCDGNMYYPIGYILYRMLAESKNSKIITLSGTPLINKPEELGILVNILHGYTTIVSGSLKRAISETTEQAIAKGNEVGKLLEANPFVDFYFVDTKPSQLGFEGCHISFTFLPPQMRKLEGGVGVRRIPPEEDLSFEERLQSIQSSLEKANIAINGKMDIQTKPLLPPTGDEFAQAFVQDDGVSLKNIQVLKKRLSGLISYYKGARKDLMPEVIRDELVFVPMSLHQQKLYSQIRLEEISIEEKEKEKKQKKFGAAWAEIYEVSAKKPSNTYRVSSRQACNFVFPDNVRRPRPLDEYELNLEAGKKDDNIIDTEQDIQGVLGKKKGEEEEGVEDAEGAEDEDEDNEEEDEEMDEQTKRRMGRLLKKQAKLEKELERQEAREKYLEERERLLQVSPEKCKAINEDLPYPLRIELARRCLAKEAKSSLTINPAEQNASGVSLADTSAKYVKMIENIQKAKGSSLVYSQFKDLEGVGIFTMALEANGFDPLKIIMKDDLPVFTPETEASLRKGPGAGRMRYMTFTGGEEDRVVRPYIVNVFNANFASLPPSLASVLQESGFETNNKGQLCRVFAITAAGAEGLSLRNVRAVHIMESYWNDVRLTQVKGRAVRICSHMDLPYDPDPSKNERTVEIFTYISVFNAEAMQRETVKSSEYKIDDKILTNDGVSIANITSLKIPGLTIPPNAKEYILTTDLFLFLVSERKKKLFTEMQKVMKSVAVDCQLNQVENLDGTYQCSLFGNVGGFHYHPDLEKDIRITTEEFGTQEQAVVAPAAKAKKTFKKEYKGVMRIFEEDLQQEIDAEGKISDYLAGYHIYNEDDPTKRVGYASVKDPSKPLAVKIEMFKL
jgi:hypothetical protein